MKKSPFQGREPLKTPNATLRSAEKEELVRE
jgi:hypothetical protein